MAVAVVISFLSFLGAEIWGGYHPLGTSLFSIQIYVEAKCFAMVTPKDVEVSTPEVYGSVSAKIRMDKIWRSKNTGGGDSLALSVVGGLMHGGQNDAVWSEEVPFGRLNDDN